MNQTPFAVVGRSVRKKDALEKVLGQARFAADHVMDNMLFGGVFRSTVPHARITALDTHAAQRLPGVVCVLTHKDIPGKNRFGIIIKDEPCLVDDKVRRIGDAIAVVAAESEEILEEALSLIQVTYELLEPVFTMEQALAEDAPRIHGTTNIHIRKKLRHGNAAEAFSRCDIIVENTYKTACLSHMFIEPDAGIAYWHKDVLTLVSSTQNPHYDRNEVAALLGLPQSRVRVIQAVTGGGFGGKLDISVQCHLALIAFHTRQPVKMERTRHESALVSSKRHPIVMHAKTGATKEGKLLALEVSMTADTGAYASYGPAVATRAMVHCTGPYEIPNVSVDALFYFSNNPMCGAFRGFGVPQAAVCHEGQMNALARALNMDPMEIRLRNAHRIGTTISTGQVLKESVGFTDTLVQAVEKFRSLAQASKTKEAPHQ